MTEVIHVPRCLLAEGEGFEPPEPFPVQWFSRPPPSTTRPSLRVEIARTSADFVSASPEKRPKCSERAAVSRMGRVLYCIVAAPGSARNKKRPESAARPSEANG